MSEPVNRTILLLDIERFGRRDDVEQTFLRRGLHDIVEDTLAAADVEHARQYREDRGDGLIILVNADVPKAALLRALLTALPDALHGYNRLAAASARMRLRVVLASGEVALDQRDGTLGGVVGHDLNQACRLLDTDALREALRARPHAATALCVSDAVYQGVVRHGPRGVSPEEFRRITVPTKDGEPVAWLHGPPGDAPGAPDDRPAGRSTGEAGDTGTPGAGAAARPGRAAATPPAGGAPPTGGAAITFHGSPHINGPVVGGDQYGVTGGTVHGDVHLGGRSAAPGPTANAPETAAAAEPTGEEDRR